jgi:ACS family glucarate transporter-like MFS transporter
MTDTRTPWSLVALLCATATAGYLCRVNASTVGALLMQEFGLTQVAMGRVFSAFLLGYALTMVPAGTLADRWGARRVLTAASWAWVVVTLLQAGIGWMPLGALPAFLALRFVLGIAAAPTYPASAAGIARWVPSLAQGRAAGIVLSSIGLGSALAPPLLSHAMVRWGWRAALVVSAVPAAVTALVWLRVREAPPRREASATRPSGAGADLAPRAREVLRRRSFVFLTASYTLQGYVGYIFVFWFYLYLVQERHFDLLQGAWMSSVPWLLSIASIPLGGWLADRCASGPLGPTWGARVVPMTGLALSGALISIGAHATSPWVAAGVLSLATALVLAVEGPFWSCLTKVAGEASGTAGGVMNLGSNVGGLISPALTPWLATVVGWEHSLHLAGLAAVVAALLWLGVGADTGQGEGGRLSQSWS